MRDRMRRGLSWFLLVTIIVSLIGLSVIVVAPIKFTEPYTEFYVLGPEGVAGNYPTNITTGSQATVIIGVGNHEHGPSTYRFVAAWNQTTFVEQMVRMEPGETREFELTLTAPSVPGNYELRLLLFREGPVADGPYRTLFLKVTVRE